MIHLKFVWLFQELEPDNERSEMSGVHVLPSLHTGKINNNNYNKTFYEKKFKIKYNNERPLYKQTFVHLFLTIYLWSLAVG